MENKPATSTYLNLPLRSEIEARASKPLSMLEVIKRAAEKKDGKK